MLLLQIAPPLRDMIGNQRVIRETPDQLPGRINGLDLEADGRS